MREEGLTKECIDCGLCTEKCEFLNKYDINLKEFEAEREDLAYNCFICGECKINCPNEIDGRKIVLKMRERSANNGQLKSKRYFSTIFEKKNYLFKNYKYGRKKTVLFPGCNFPSFYPDTTRKLIRELKETADIGVVFDCCGKPINELGLTKDADKIVNNIDDKLAKMSVEEIVTLCPNCYYFLKDKLNVNVTDIYKKLCELGMESSLGVKQINVFTPCPDREEKLIRKSMKPFLAASDITEIKDVQCCGLGGHGGIKEPELSKTFVNKLKDKQLNNVYTYCASCCGNFNRNDIVGVKHILCEIMQSDESPAKGIGSLINRAKFKFRLGL